MNNVQSSEQAIRPLTAQVNDQRHLVIGGCDVVDLIAEYGSPLYVYGETVNLLVERGELESAERLERHWSHLAERDSVALLCGYLAVNFGDPETARALRSLCQEHSHVISDPEDLLATFLLSAYEAQPPAASVVSRKLE